MVLETLYISSQDQDALLKTYRAGAPRLDIFKEISSKDELLDDLESSELEF